MQGMDMPFEYTLSARNLFNQLKFYRQTIPERGDLIFFWRGSIDSWMGHMGFIFSRKGTNIITIEGNKGKFPSVVAKYAYTFGRITDLLGYVRVPDKIS